MSAFLAAGGTTGAALPPTSASVPVTLDATGTAATVSVSIGGSDPIVLHLDTGSFGLVLGPEVHVTGATDTGVPFEQKYTGHSVTSTLFTAPITLGPVATAPVTFAIADSVECADGGDECWPYPGTQGTLGIAQGVHDAGSGLTLSSPLASLPSPLGDGFTLTVGSDDPGSLVLGEPDHPADWPTAAMTATSDTYPNGNPVFEKAIDLCWDVAGVTACMPTSLDSGAPAGTVFDVPGASFGGLPRVGSVIQSGLPIDLSAAGSPFANWTTGPPSDDLVVRDAAASFDRFNTGIGFFLGRSVAFDAVAGSVSVAPADAEAAPVDEAPVPSLDATQATDPGALAPTGSGLWGALASSAALLAGGVALAALPRAHRRRAR